MPKDTHDETDLLARARECARRGSEAFRENELERAADEFMNGLKHFDYPDRFL